MPLISAVLAIFIFFLNIPLPNVLVSSLNSLGNVTTPVAMIILGSTIASMPLKELINDWRIYIFTFVKLMVLPFAIWGILHQTTSVNSLISSVMIILSGTPVATNATMLSIQYGGDKKLVSKGILFTTVLSVITIPILTILLL